MPGDEGATLHQRRAITQSAKSSITRYCRLSGGSSMIWLQPLALQLLQLFHDALGHAGEAGGPRSARAVRNRAFLRVHEAVVAAVQALMPHLGGPIVGPRRGWGLPHRPRAGRRLRAKRLSRCCATR